MKREKAQREAAGGGTTKKKTALRILCGFLAFVVLLAAIAAVLLYIATHAVFWSFREDNPYDMRQGMAIEELRWKQGEETYVYNTNLVNVLILGIDKTSQRELAPGDVGYQADTIVLVSLDTKTGAVKMLHIPRDTQAPVMRFDADGLYAYTAPGPLCIAHGYGADREMGGKLTEAAVSNFLYGVPINRFFSIDIDGIAPAVDFVGGVELMLLEDMTMAQPDMAQGTLYRLDGRTAEIYVRDRQLPGMSGDDIDRVRRQMQFLQEFVSVLTGMVKENPWVAYEFYTEMKPYTATDLRWNELTYLGYTVIQTGVPELLLLPEEALEDTRESDILLRDFIREWFFVLA